MDKPTLSNAEIADRLEDVANLLEDQGANQYRVQAWRGGAATIRGHERSAAELLREQGIEGLDRLPGIGAALARAVRELVDTGRLSTLERLRGESDPVALLASVPGIGYTLAERLHEELAIDTLEQLELAAYDGRLAGLPGFGEKRVAGIQDALAARLRARRPRAGAENLPAVEEILEVDREYRERAAAGDLPLIAPRRFNPTGERWLPILHTARGARQYTALFSNTAAAHRFGRTHDWVVLYYDGKDGERQCTIVTAYKGPLARRRVVRGRESECVGYYRLTAGRERRHMTSEARRAGASRARSSSRTA